MHAPTDLVATILWPQAATKLAQERAQATNVHSCSCGRPQSTTAEQHCRELLCVDEQACKQGRGWIYACVEETAAGQWRCKSSNSAVMAIVVGMTALQVRCDAVLADRTRAGVVRWGERVRGGVRKGDNSEAVCVCGRAVSLQVLAPGHLCTLCGRACGLLACCPCENRCDWCACRRLAVRVRMHWMGYHDDV